MNLANLLDIIGKNVSRIKTVGFVVVIIFFSLSLINNGCERSRAEDMVEKITGLNIQNDILNNGITARDSAIIKNELIILELTDSLKNAEKKFTKLESKYWRIKSDFKDLSKELIQISTDSSYSFLVHHAYPYKGKYEYLFNAPQVKGIHLTYLENKSLINLNSNLTEQKDLLSFQLSIRDSIVDKTDQKIASMQENRKDLQKLIVNKDEEIETREKNAKKKKRNNTFKTIGIGVIALVIGFLAGS